MKSSEIGRFKNLECLLTCRFDCISKDTLQKLPELRELQYNGGFEDVYARISRMKLGERVHGRCEGVKRVRLQIRRFSVDQDDAGPDQEL